MSQKKNTFILISICVLYFIAFCFPNRAASKDLDMVSAMQPDEAVPLSYAFHMIQPADSVKQTLKNFAFYNYYFYGYPYFAYSALALLPLELANVQDEMPLVMLTLRQIVSVLPMLIAILLLVYMQTEFKSYKAYFLLLFLLGIPAVFQNNLWWHPDSLAILFVVLTMFFLYRDNLRLGWNFYLSAAMCGFASGTKSIGWYFFLAIFIYILVVVIQKKSSIVKIIFAGLGFVFIMGAAYLFSNPLLVFASIRQQYINAAQSQYEVLATGYGILYPKGIFETTPYVRTYYGEWVVVLIAFGACIWAALRGPKRIVNIIILAYAIPLTVFVFAFIHFKYQYWMPAMLPVFSSMVVILPDRLKDWEINTKMKVGKVLIRFCGVLLLVVVVAQFVSYSFYDAAQYSDKLYAETTNPSLSFNTKILDVLSPLPQSETCQVYHDARLYVSARDHWVISSTFGMLDYGYIEEGNFDVILLLQQRIDKYLNPNAVGVDPTELAESQIFYSDADQGVLTGYSLVYLDSVGLIFIRDDLYKAYFSQTESDGSS